jgi:hypothetical protein
MRIYVGRAVLAAAAVAAAFAGTASAQSNRLSDVAYVEAARCAGLANSGKLGAGDGAALAALLKSQSYGRDQTVLDQASDAQQQAKRQASHADDYTRGRLQAELTGTCSSFRG